MQRIFLLSLLGVSVIGVALLFIFFSPKVTNQGTVLVPRNPVASVGGEFSVPTKPEESRMQFFGDIMLDRNVAKAMAGKGDLDYIFAHVSTTNFLDTTNFLVANLEGPFAPSRVPTSKEIAFRFDPKLAAQLQAYGFDAVGLANNHSYDMGRANVPFTRNVLDSAGIGHFGDELAEGKHYTLVVTTSPKLLEPVAFVGVHNTYHEPDRKELATVLADAKSQAKIVVVNVHWGQEYIRTSNQKQRTLAHWLVDNGASLVIGHHPHVVQEMELYNGVPIFYSLGNFIFDQYFSKETQEGLSVVVAIKDGKISRLELIPFFGVNSQVYLMTGEKKLAFLKWMKDTSRLENVELNESVITF